MIPGDGLKFFPRITPIPESELVSQQQRRRRAWRIPTNHNKNTALREKKIVKHISEYDYCNVQTSRFIS